MIETSPHDWTVKPLEEFIKIQRGFDLPEGQRIQGSVPVMGSFGGITGWHNEARVKGPGVTIGRSGASFGAIGYCPTDYWPLNTTLFVTDFLGNVPRFVQYLLQKIDFKGFDTGSAQPSLNRNHIAKLTVAVPSSAEQKAIICVLGALEDKIALNHRMNATLEEMAQTLFRSWFVNFDPVKVKAESSQPERIDSETAAFFPDTLKDTLKQSEIGMIPQGWQVMPIGECVQAVGGGTPKTSEATYWDNGTVAWVTPKDLSPLTSPVLLDTERKITQAGLKQVSSGLLPQGTVLLSSRAPIGYLAISEIPVTVNQGFIAMVCNKALPNLYVLYWAKENREAIEARANGSTFMEISKSSFRPIPALVPTPAVLDQFMTTAGPWHQQIVTNLRESATLAQLRDSLLSKLISGEVRLPHDMVADFGETPA